MEIQDTNFDCVVVNGDSYSDPTGGKVYGDFLAEYFDIPVENFACKGSNNDRILRSTIEYIQKIKQQYYSPLIVVGWSFVRRLEIWYEGNHASLLKMIPDDELSRFITLDHVFYAGEATLEQKALINDDKSVHKQLVDFYTKLYLFGQLMESLNWKYICFSAAKNTDCPLDCFPYIANLYQAQWVDQNPYFYKLHDFCIQDWAQENDADCKELTGHLSTTGHEKFSKYIIRNMLQNA